MGVRVRSWIGGVVMALLSVAQAPAQEMSQRWHSAILSGSERLLLFSLRDEVAPDLRRAAAGIAGQQALTFPKGHAPVAGSLELGAAPILAWDPNLNGGIPGETIMIAGLPFTVDEDSRAKAGAVLGFSVSARQSVASAPGVLWGWGANAALRHAPEEDIRRSDVGLSLCRKQYVERWSWIDLCLNATYQNKAGVEVTELVSSARVSHMFALPGADLEAGLTVQGARRSDYRKAGLAVDGVAAVAGIGAVSMRYAFGERVERRHTLHQSLDLSLTRPILGASTRLTMGLLAEDGSRLFGQVREDRVISVGVTRPVTKRVAVSLGLQHRESTVDAYDEDVVTFGVNVVGWGR